MIRKLKRELRRNVKNKQFSGMMASEQSPKDELLQFSLFKQNEDDNKRKSQIETFSSESKRGSTFGFSENASPIIKNKTQNFLSNKKIHESLIINKEKTNQRPYIQKKRGQMTDKQLEIERNLFLKDLTQNFGNNEQFQKIMLKEFDRITYF